MSKKETLALVLAVLSAHKVEDKVVAEITALLEPKKGGAVLDINEIAKFEDGELTHIMDSVTGEFMPLHDEDGNENFYAKPDTQLGWSRLSRASEKARKEAEKAKKASTKAIMDDVLDGNITPEEAKELLAAL
ncbi:MAG: hypothetical protein JHC33_03815 [Ignisphaera sp.]|nr:hypothetical protein [Ignisphaera sp.]